MYMVQIIIKQKQSAYITLFMLRNESQKRLIKNKNKAATGFSKISTTNLQLFYPFTLFFKECKKIKFGTNK
jgi:hypothetical protein